MKNTKIRNEISLSGSRETFSDLRQPGSLTALTSLTPSPPSPVRVTSISLLKIRRAPHFPTAPVRCFEGHWQNPKTYLGETWTLKYVQKSRWISWNPSITDAGISITTCIKAVVCGFIIIHPISVNFWNLSLENFVFTNLQLDFSH